MKAVSSAHALEKWGGDGLLTIGGHAAALGFWGTRWKKAFFLQESTSEKKKSADEVFAHLNRPMTEREKRHWSKIAEEQFGFMEPYRQKTPDGISHEWSDIKESVMRGKAVEIAAKEGRIQAETEDER